MNKEPLFESSTSVASWQAENRFSLTLPERTKRTKTKYPFVMKIARGNGGRDEDHRCAALAVFLNKLQVNLC